MRKWFPRFLNSSYPKDKRGPYSFWTIGGSGMPLKDLKSGSRPHFRRRSLTNSEEEILGVDRLTTAPPTKIARERR